MEGLYKRSRRPLASPHDHAHQVRQHRHRRSGPRARLLHREAGVQGRHRPAVQRHAALDRAAHRLLGNPLRAVHHGGRTEARRTVQPARSPATAWSGPTRSSSSAGWNSADRRRRSRGAPTRRSRTRTATSSCSDRGRRRYLRAFPFFRLESGTNVCAGRLRRTRMPTARATRNATAAATTSTTAIDCQDTTMAGPPNGFPDTRSARTRKRAPSDTRR
jgi:hypothetical protein